MALVSTLVGVLIKQVSLFMIKTYSERDQGYNSLYFSTYHNINRQVILCSEYIYAIGVIKGCQICACLLIFNGYTLCLTSHSNHALQVNVTKFVSQNFMPPAHFQDVAAYLFTIEEKL